MTSRALGYVRDIIIAGFFGQTRVTDAYQAAFSIPDFLYNLLIAGTVTAAFIPVFSRYVAIDHHKESRVVGSTIYNIAVLAMSCGLLIAALFAPVIVSVIVPGFEPEYMSMTILMTRIMLIQAFFMALNGISAGVLHSYQRFLEPAVASVMYNLMIIVLGIALSKYIGITAFAVGVTVGAIVQFGVLFTGLWKVGFRWSPVLQWKHPGVIRVFGLMIPVFLSYAFTQLGLFIQQNIASSLRWGSLTAMRSAQRLMQMPVAIFAITMIIAIYPTLNAHVARGEMDAFIKSFGYGLRSIFYITLPCAVGLAVLSEPAIRMLYQQGSYTAENTALTASTLVFFCIGLPAQGGVHMMNRVFYAMQNTWTPVKIGASTIIINIILNYLLIGPLGLRGLALAYSMAVVINLLLLLYLAKRKIGHIGGRGIAASFVKSLGMSVVMGGAAYLTAHSLGNYIVNLDAKIGQLTQVGGAIIVSLAVYFGLSVLLRMEEFDMVRRMLRRERKHDDMTSTQGVNE